MNTVSVNGLRSLELGVFDLDASADFYKKNWALQEVGRHGDALLLRAAGPDHHVLTLRQRPRAGLLSVTLSVADRASVDAMHAKVKGLGVEILSAPHALPAEMGGGYGFELKNPDGFTMRISADVADHKMTDADVSRPQRVNHVVFNTEDIDRLSAFFCDTLGFKFSDSNGFMNFVRCSRNHHSLAMAKSHGPSLNHVAYEMTDFDGLMRGVGRMKMADQEIGWGVGRHAGPGRNIFSYFVDPNGYAIEYTTEVDQVDDTYVARHGDYWQSLPLAPCAWQGNRMVAKDFMRHAMSGKAVEEKNAACDDAISKKMAS